MNSSNNCLSDLLLYLLRLHKNSMFPAQWVAKIVASRVALKIFVFSRFVCENKGETKFTVGPNIPADSMSRQITLTRGKNQATTKESGSTVLI